MDDFITTETIFTLKDPQSYENFLNELILDEFTSDKIEILLLDDSYFSMMDNLDELHNTSRFMYILCAAVLMLLFVYLLLIYTKKKINEFDILFGLGFANIDLYKLILQQFSLYSFIGLIFASLISLVCGFIFFTTLLRQIIIVLAISCVLIQLVVILYSFVITSLILKLIKHGL